MNNKLMMGVVWCFLLVANLNAQPSELERRLTLSSGYVERYFNSNEGLVYFPLTVMEGYSKLFDVVADNFNDHWGKRLTVGLLELPFSYWLTMSLFVPFHEFGHAHAAQVQGYKYSYGSYGYGLKFKGLTNFWSLSAIRAITPPFFIPGSGIAYTTSAGFGDAKAESRVILSAAGMNNQSLFAKKIAEQIYERNGHITYFQHYITNKFTPFIYAVLDQDDNPQNDFTANGVSDPASILRGYKQIGYDIKHQDFKTQAIVSLVSGTTASLLKGYYDYLVHGDPVVRSFELFGLRMFELNGYINARGLSFEVETDYRIKPYLTAGLAYEFIWKGGNDHNVTPRARYNVAHALPILNEMWVKGDMVIGRGVGGSLGIDYAPFPLNKDHFWSRLAYSLDFHLYNAKNLYGERNITTGNTIAFDPVLAVHMRY